MDGRFVLVFCCSTLLLFIHQISASCGPPVKDQNSDYRPIKSRYYVRDKVIFSCRSGCVPSGFSTSTCGQYGWYPPSPRCICYVRPTYPTVRPTTRQQYYCGPPTKIAHGIVNTYTSQTRYSVGAKVTYKCNYGYTLVGDPVATCGHHGWSHVPICKGKCKRPENPPYGRVVSANPHQSDYTIGERVRYECNPGYCMQGDATVYCQQHGWARTPSCVAGCKKRAAPHYGSSGDTSKRHWCPGDQETYYCNRGYRMFGYQRSTCGKGGKWDNDVPTCKKICGKAPTLQYGILVHPNPSKPSYGEDECLTYRCSKGYCMKGNPRVCCKHHGYENMPKCMAGCKKRAGPSYGSYVNPRDHYCPGDSAQFKCDRYFRIYGSATSYCGDNGKWRTDVPSCRRVCGKAQDLQYGEVVPSSSKPSYEEGDYVTYRCKPGYCLYGNPRVPCGHKGFGDMPRCRRQCTHRNAPSYGSYHGDHGSNTKWCPGQRARYQCKPTFRVAGHEYSRCQDDGSWEYDVPTCKKICRRPADPQYGFVVSPRTKQEYAEDESVSYRCNAGYCMHGNPTAYCRHHGFTAAPSCRAGCKKRDGPSYGSYVNPRDHYCPGDSAQFKCDRYFRIYGSATSYCGDNGKWRTDVPSCRRVCGKAQDLQYGEVVPSSSKPSYEEGDYVTYRCKPGYCLYGNPRVPCGHKGFGDTPRCRPGCGKRPAPSYGSYINPRDHYCPGDSAQFKCDRYFRLYGSATSSCDDKGQWRTAVPRCKRVCGKAQPLQYGVVVSSKPSYEEGDYVTYRCNSGYCLYGNARVPCGHKGFGDMPRCRPGCNKRDGPSYGSYVNPRDHYCPEDSAQFKCDRYFRLYGSATSYCGYDGNWRSPVPRCRRVCGKAPTVAYGYVKLDSRKSSYEEGDSITYACNPGYCLYGDAKVQCGHDGFGKLPRCNPGCGKRTGPSYGSYINPRDHYCPGDSAQFKCDRYFRLYGSATSSCGDKGQWRTAVPRCKRVCGKAQPLQYGVVVFSKPSYEEDDYVTYRCNSGYCLYGNPRVPCGHKGFGDMPRCRPGCNKRDGPSYGSYVNPRDHYCPEDSAQFKCDEKFRLYGSATSYCDHDGKWRSPVPRCRRVCGKAPTVAYGYVKLDSRKSSYEEGDSITYACNPGYCLYGDAKVQCGHKGFGKLPRCNQACARPKAPDYGSISGSKLFYCPGESVSYKCGDGYDISGYEKSTCQYNYKWDNKVPTCTKKCKLSSPPKHGYFVRTARPKITYSLDEYVTVRCNTGYCGGGNMFCRKHGWDTSVLCRHGCPVRDPPAHGAYVETRRYYCPGDRAAYKCKYGYEIKGHSSSACNNNYGWDRPLPLCKRICQLPSPPPYGSVHATPSHKTRFHEDEWVSVSCYSGYQLQGNSKVYCRENGWEPMPTCRKYQPPPPTYPPHPPHYGQPSSPSCNRKCGLVDVGGCSCNHRCLNGYGTCCKDFKEKCGEAFAGLSSPYGK